MYSTYLIYFTHFPLSIFLHFCISVFFTFLHKSNISLNSTNFTVTEIVPLLTTQLSETLLKSRYCPPGVLQFSPRLPLLTDVLHLAGGIIQEHTETYLTTKLSVTHHFHELSPISVPAQHSVNVLTPRYCSRPLLQFLPSKSHSHFTPITVPTQLP